MYNCLKRSMFDKTVCAKNFFSVYNTFQFLFKNVYMQIVIKTGKKRSNFFGLFHFCMLCFLPSPNLRRVFIILRYVNFFACFVVKTWRILNEFSVLNM